MKQTISKAKWQCHGCEATYVTAVNQFWEQQDSWPCSCGGRVVRIAQQVLGASSDLAIVRRLQRELELEKGCHEAAVAMASRICGDAAWKLSHAIEALAMGDRDEANRLIEAARKQTAIVATSAELKEALEN